MNKLFYYNELMSSYARAHPQRKKQDIQKEANAIWNTIKKCDDLAERISELKAKYDQKAMQSKASLMGYWLNSIQKMQKSNLNSNQPVSSESQSETITLDHSKLLESTSSGEIESDKVSRTELIKQDQSQQSSSLVQPQGKSYKTPEQEKQLRALQSDNAEMEKSFKKLEADQMKHGSIRLKRKQDLMPLENAKKIRSSSIERKQHVANVPERPIRAENDSHKEHIDEKFCSATIKSLEEMSSFLGPKEVAFLSQDDKARVTIGLTAANEHAPLLMHVEYKVSLPDNDWVVASKHQLIPSVYAGIAIKTDGLGKPEFVGYTGPTYIAIRSGKHSACTAFAHALDFERIIDLPAFQSIMRTEDKLLKPVVVVNVDGGPDENPRYQKVIATSVHNFIKNDLDAFFIATNAPSRNCSKRVERRLAPLSREITGVILPRENYGSHLDLQGNTIDSTLEENNFELAGQCLAEVWSSFTLDTFPNESELDAEQITSKDEVWMHNHVRTSQYFTQIVKCNDRSCCKQPRSSYFNFFSRFFPLPIPIIQSETGTSTNCGKKK